MFNAKFSTPADRCLSRGDSSLLNHGPVLKGPRPPAGSCSNFVFLLRISSTIGFKQAAGCGTTRLSGSCIRSRGPTTRGQPTALENLLGSILESPQAQAKRGRPARRPRRELSPSVALKSENPSGRQKNGPANGGSNGGRPIKMPKPERTGDSVQGRWRINAALNNPQVAVKGQSEPWR